jgi:hypothetical protein
VRAADGQRGLFEPRVIGTADENQAARIASRSMQEFCEEPVTVGERVQGRPDRDRQFDSAQLVATGD